MTEKTFSHSLRTIAIILFVLALLFLLFGWWLEPQLEQFLTGGWLQSHSVSAGLIAIALLVADILLPVPNSVVCAVIGSIFGPVLGTAIGWFGLTLGSVAGYRLGKNGLSRCIPEDNHSTKSDFHGFGSAWILVICRPLPLLGEASVVAAGYYRMKFSQFLIPVMIANLVLALAWSVLGYLAIDNGWIVIGMIAAGLIPVVAAFAWLGWISRKAQRSTD